jgi:hypothetical protein
MSAIDLELEFLDYELAENIPNGGVLIALEVKCVNCGTVARWEI